jgi:hypothetical protein
MAARFAGKTPPTPFRNLRPEARVRLVALRRPLQSLKDLVEIETLRLLSRRILYVAQPRHWRVVDSNVPNLNAVLAEGLSEWRTAVRTGGVACLTVIVCRMRTVTCGIVLSQLRAAHRLNC